jgi:hypothetical protein
MKLMTAMPHNSAVLDPENSQSVRDAYKMAIDEIASKEKEFDHLNPPTIGRRLANLLIRLSRDEQDPKTLSTKAVAAIRTY